MKHNFTDLLSGNNIVPPNNENETTTSQTIEVEGNEDLDITPPDFSTVGIEIETSTEDIQSPLEPVTSSRVDKFKSIKSSKRKKLVIQTSSVKQEEPSEAPVPPKVQTPAQGVPMFRPDLNLNLNDDIIEETSETQIEESVKVEEPVLFAVPVQPVQVEEPTIVPTPVQVEDPILFTTPIQPVQVEEPVVIPEPIKVEEPVVFTAPVQVEEPIVVSEPVQVEEIIEVPEPVQVKFNPSEVLNSIETDEVEVAAVNDTTQPSSKKQRKTKKPSKVLSFLADLDLPKAMSVFLVVVAVAAIVTIVYFMSSGQSIYKQASNDTNTQNTEESSLTDNSVQTPMSEQVYLEDEVSLKQKTALNQGLPLNYYTLLETLPTQNEKVGDFYSVEYIYVSLNPTSVGTKNYNGRDYSESAGFISIATSYKLTDEQELMFRDIVSSLLENKAKTFFENKEAVAEFLKIGLESGFKGVNLKVVEFHSND